MAYIANLIPTTEFTVIHLNQYEYGIDNVITVAIFNGDTPFTIPDGSTIVVTGTRPDGKVFVSSQWVIFEGNEVVFEIQQEMTYVYGEFEFEIVISNGNNRWSTTNLKFNVERSPLNEDLPVSEDEIPACINVAHYNAMRAQAAANEAVEAAESVAGDVDDAKEAAISAGEYAVRSETAATTAASAASTASDASSRAEESATDASTSVSTAHTYSRQAKTYSELAESSATSASSSEASAKHYAEVAADAATASPSAQAAEASAEQAATSAASAQAALNGINAVVTEKVIDLMPAEVASQVAQMQVKEGQTVIDETLTVSGAAAEAKTVGDALQHGFFNQRAKIPFVINPAYNDNMGEIHQTNGAASLSIVDDKLVVTRTSDNPTYQNFGFYLACEEDVFGHNIGHKIYVKIVGLDHSNVSNYRNCFIDGLNDATSVRLGISFTDSDYDTIITAPNNFGRFVVGCYSYPVASEGDYFTLDYVQYIDLTEMFGEGNEPTIEQFREAYTEFPYSFTYTGLHASIENENTFIYSALSSLSGDYSNLLDLAFMGQEWIGADTNLDDILIPGIYAKTANTVVTGLPDNITSEDSFMLVVMTHRRKSYITSTSNFIVQFLVHQSKGIYYRYRTDNGWRAWNSDLATMRTDLNTLEDFAFMGQEWIQNNTDLNTIVVPGIYAKSANDVTANNPTGVLDSDGFLLITFTHRRKSYVSQSSNFIVQMLITNSKGIFYRYKSDGGWNTWYEFAKVVDAFTMNGWIAGETDLNTLMTPGIYAKSEGDVSYNTPSEIAGTAAYVLVTLTHRNKNLITQNSNFTVQLLITRSFGFFYRYRSDSGWNAWKKLADEAETFTLNGWLETPVDLNDIVKPGVYARSQGGTTTNQPKYVPTTEAYILVVFTHRRKDVTADVNFIEQIFISSSYGIYARYKSTNAWFSWSPLTNELTRLATEDYGKITKSLEQAKRSWTPASSKMMRSVNIPEDETQEPTLNYFDEGTTYNHIPYRSVVDFGLDVFHDRNLATFFSAVQNPASLLYEPISEREIDYAKRMDDDMGIRYGGVCSTFSEWLLGDDTYRAVREMDEIIDYYDYTGPESIEVGDVLVANKIPSYFDHIRIVSGINIRTRDYIVDSFVIAQQGNTFIATYTPAQIEEMFLPENGGYRLGRYKKDNIRAEKAVRFATDVIANMGNNTFYYPNDEVWLYIPKGDTLYWKKDDEGYNQVAKSTLNTKTVNDVTVYEVTSIMNTVGKYYFTTDLTKNQKCELYRVDTGSITLSGNTVTLSGYSDGIEPLYYQIMILKDGSQYPTGFPAPDGYRATRKNNSEVYVENDTFTVTIPTKQTDPEMLGWYVMVYYKNEFGKPRGVSNYIML